MKRVFVWMLAAIMLLSMAACGTEEPAEKADLSNLYDACTASMTPMMLVEGDTRRDFMGIEEEDCLQVFTAFAEDGLLTDELWLIEAKDQAAFDRLKALAEGRMEAKKEETVSYSPEQYAVVEQGVILEKGLYLVLIVSPNVDVIRADVEMFLK